MSNVNILESTDLIFRQGDASTVSLYLRRFMDKCHHLNPTNEAAGQLVEAILLYRWRDVPEPNELYASLVLELVTSSPEWISVVAPALYSALIPADESANISASLAPPAAAADYTAHLISRILTAAPVLAGSAFHAAISDAAPPLPAHASTATRTYISAILAVASHVPSLLVRSLEVSLRLLAALDVAALTAWPALSPQPMPVPPLPAQAPQPSHASDVSFGADGSPGSLCASPGLRRRESLAGSFVGSFVEATSFTDGSVFGTLVKEPLLGDPASTPGACAAAPDPALTLATDADATCAEVVTWVLGQVRAARLADERAGVLPGDERSSLMLFFRPLMLSFNLWAGSPLRLTQWPLFAAAAADATLSDTLGSCLFQTAIVADGVPLARVAAARALGDFLSTSRSCAAPELHAFLVTSCQYLGQAIATAASHMSFGPQTASKIVAGIVESLSPAITLLEALIKVVAWRRDFFFYRTPGTNTLAPHPVVAQAGLAVLVVDAGPLLLCCDAAAVDAFAQLVDSSGCICNMENGVRGMRETFTNVNPAAVLGREGATFRDYPGVAGLGVLRELMA